MSKAHANISVFVPHLGCPNACSFCNQRHITGTAEIPTAATVKQAVEASTVGSSYISENSEIAFFGGSFTAIERGFMLELLSAAYEYVKNGTVKGIRISTRPDAIDEEILEILKKYGVTAIELGAQSMDGKVLEFNRRGHTAEDVKKASAMIKNAGFELGLQMMTGLPLSTPELDIKTAKEFIKLKPETVRIYPTIVLENTCLADMVRNGDYLPQKLCDAIELSGELLSLFQKEGIKVIRLGLHSVEEGSYVAGPWHPAFSELVYSSLYFKNAFKSLADLPRGEYNIFVANGSTSKMVGQKRCNILRLAEKGYFCKVKEDNNLREFEIIIERKCK